VTRAARPKEVWDAVGALPLLPLSPGPRTRSAGGEAGYGLPRFGGPLGPSSAPPLRADRVFPVARTGFLVPLVILIETRLGASYCIPCLSKDG